MLTGELRTTADERLRIMVQIRDGHRTAQAELGTFGVLALACDIADGMVADLCGHHLAVNDHVAGTVDHHVVANTGRCRMVTTDEADCTTKTERRRL